jgi:hypothetical protein
MGHEVQFLEDDGNAGCLGRARAGESDRLAFEENVSGIRRQDARQNVHQRGFASAILPEQCVEPAPLNGDVHVIQGADAGKRLGDAARFQPGVRLDEMSGEQVHGGVTTMVRTGMTLSGFRSVSSSSISAQPANVICAPTLAWVFNPGSTWVSTR